MTKRDSAKPYIVLSADPACRAIIEFMPAEPPVTPPGTPMPPPPRIPWWRLALLLLLLAAEIVMAAVLILAAMLFSFMPFFADTGNNTSAAHDLLLRAASIFYGLSAILAICSISQQHPRYYVDVIVGLFLAVASGIWGGTLLSTVLGPTNLSYADNSFTTLAIVAGLLYLALAGAGLVGIRKRRSWWLRLTRQGAAGLIASSAFLLLTVRFSLFTDQDTAPAGDWEIAAAMMALGIAVAVLGRARSKTHTGN